MNIFIVFGLCFVVFCKTSNIVKILVKPKLRKVERRLVPVIEMLSVDELMETNTYQRFNRLIDAVFEVVDDENFINDTGIIRIFIRNFTNRHFNQ